jgi:hypothetical protein
MCNLSTREHSCVDVICPCNLLLLPPRIIWHVKMKIVRVKFLKFAN